MSSPKTLTLLAPAKINLLLYVLRRGPKGYHRVHSLNQMVSLFDRLRLTAKPPGYGVRLSARGRSVPRGEDNLVVRAARLFLKRYRIKAGVRIELAKRIPVGAGLGGGSSDAAATLAGLARLFRPDLRAKGLARLGARLGSDIPFFFFGPTAWVSGIGELVHPVRPGEPYWAVLVNPGFPVSTAWAYTQWDRRRPSGIPNREKSLEKWGLTLRPGAIKIIPRISQAFPRLKRFLSLHNDLEAITAERYPVIEAMMGPLRAKGAEDARMSGSGPTVFGIFKRKAQAGRAAAALRRIAASRIRSEGTRWMVRTARFLVRPPWG